jgi:rubrerythrin
VFGVEEVFDIAIEIERNGAAFYREAAAVIADEAVRQELLDLARMEDEHEETFRVMKRHALGDEALSSWYDPDGEAASYLKTIAEGKVFSSASDAIQALPQPPTIRDIMLYAIERERESVLFFTGMRNTVPAHLGSGKVDAIISQEMGHVALLTKKLGLL